MQARNFNITNPINMKNKTTFTPGHWEVSNREGLVGINIDNWDLKDSKKPERAILICQVFGKQPKYNALLISKAPEMYELLKEARQMLILNTLLDKSGQTKATIEKIELIIKSLKTTNNKL